MKSLTVSVFWPAWLWGPVGFPNLQFMFTSYAQALSTRDSIKCRQLIRSDWYQSLWGDQFQMVKDQDTLTQFRNDKNGYRLATSVEGLATGERGDIDVADDPHNVMEAESERKRHSTLRWWDEAMTSRVNDPAKSAFVVIMQRVHQKDLAGHLISQGGWTTLTLPMEFEPDSRCYTSVWPKDLRMAGTAGNGPYCWDPRQQEGELYWPDRYLREDVDLMKEKMGSYAVASQFQMRPSPRGGGMVKLRWFQRYREPPGNNLIKRIVQSWDTAQTAQGTESAYSVCTTWAETAVGHYLLHVLRRRMGIPTIQRTAVAHATLWRPNAILIENKSSGPAVIQHIRETTTLPVIEINPDKDKVVRMDVETPVIEAGNVYLPEEADWLPDFESEVEVFPNSQYMDQVDSMSQYLRWIRTGTFWVV